MIRVPNLNLVMLAGRLTAKPESNETKNGKSVSNFTLAVNQNYRDASGEWKSKASFADITAWGKLAEYSASLKKGSPVLVQGSIQSRSWSNEEGETNSSFEVMAQKVQFLEKQGGNSSKSEESETDDELPF